MKKLEKIDKFQIKNQKLQNVLGGEGGPAQSFLSIDSGQVTGAGEYCQDINGDGKSECIAYTSDMYFGNGLTGYSGGQVVNKSC